MSWDYRVMRHQSTAPDGEPEEWYAIHEVYEDEHVKPSWTKDPVGPDSETVEDMRWVLERMMEATHKPVLEYEEG